VDEVFVGSDHKADNAFYDLQGRKVASPALAPGIYIQNGVKVSVK
jgi:hypothetical protein